MCYVQSNQAMITEFQSSAPEVTDVTQNEICDWQLGTPVFLSWPKRLT